MSEVSFFSEADMYTTKEGKKIVSSEFPAWYNRSMVDDIKDDISMTEYAIKSGRLTEDKLMDARNKLTKLKEKVNVIENSIPKLSDKQKDMLSKVRGQIGEEIANSMFSRSDMTKGIADVHEEARRMSEPKIQLSPEMVDVAKMCNVNHLDGKVSRTGAEKMWKIVSRYLGEQSNTESLRRD